MVFSAVRTADRQGSEIYNNVHPQEVITFTHTEANIGSGMNPDTGIFTVPLSGIYYFSFSARTLPPGFAKATRIQVFLNDESQFLIAEDLDLEDTFSLIGWSWTMNLAKNDKIHLFMLSNGLYVTPDNTVWFNGQLLMAQ